MNDRNIPAPPTVEDGISLLDIAQKAAVAKDVLGMVEALHASGYLDGLVRRIRAKWSDLPREDVRDCVAEAVNSVYEAVTDGRRVGQLGAWLWKTADNLANDRWRDDYQGRRSVDNLPEQEDCQGLDDDERARLDTLADHRRSEAVRLARRLLPKVGQGQVVAVMEIVIDTVEAGLPDLSAEAVGETLGITTAAARALMSRGLERLRRAARDEGIEFPEQMSVENQSPERTLETTEEEAD